MSSKSPPTPKDPHDRLFKVALGHKKNACDFLAAVLPKSILTGLKLKKLKVVRNEHIDHDLGLRTPDIVYEVPFRGRSAFLCTLLEHQSTNDPTMPLRLLSAMNAFWLDHIRAHPRTSTVPMLIGIVVAHAPGGWKAATRFADIYDGTPAERAALGPSLLDFEYVLEDLCAQNDAELAGRLRETYLIAALLSLKRRGHAPSPAHKTLFLEVFRRLAETGNSGAIQTLVRYIMAVAPRGKPSMVEVIKNAHPVYEKAYVSHYDHALEKGIEKGEARVLAKQLTKKFGPLSVATKKRLEKASAKDLERWAERILTAEKLSEVFAKSR